MHVLWKICVLISSLLILSSCSMVGETVDYSYPLQCRWMDCNINDENFTFVYKLTNDNNICNVSGYIEATGSLSNSFGFYTRSYATIHLVGCDRKIVKSLPIASGPGDMTKKIEFNKDFECVEFSSSAVTYGFEGRGQ